MGNVVILASRLSDAAAPGEILVSQRLNAFVEGAVTTEPIADLTLEGFSKPVPVFRVGARAWTLLKIWCRTGTMARTTQRGKLP